MFPPSHEQIFFTLLMAV